MSEREQRPKVLVDERRLGDAWLTHVAEACREARIEALPWNEDWKNDRDVPAAGRPVLLISALGHGERRIPDDLVELMTQRFPGLPLLLVVADELVRPVVSLQDGRVTLLGPPFSVQRLSARIRLLIVEQQDDSRIGKTEVYGRMRVATLEHSTPKAYYAYAACGSETLRPEDVVPNVETFPGGGFRALLAVDGLPMLSHATEKLSAIIAADEDDDERERHLAAILGASTGLATLTPSNEWVYYWPNPSFELSLISALRFPRHFRFSDSLARTGGSLIRLVSAPGDVIVGIWGQPDADAESKKKERDAQLTDAALAGGPIVLDTLVEWLRRSDDVAIGFVAEVR